MESNQSKGEIRSFEETQNYNYLLLSIYFYLKHNNYNTTAENLFNESDLKNIFKFPQEVKEGTNPSDRLIKKFIQHFYYNSYFNSEQPDDTTADFWNQFEKDTLILTCKNIFYLIFFIR